MSYDWHSDTYVRQDDTEPTTYMVSAATADHPEVSVFFSKELNRWCWAEYHRASTLIVISEVHRLPNVNATQEDAMSAAESYFTEQPGLDQEWAMGEADVS